MLVNIRTNTDSSSLSYPLRFLSLWHNYHVDIDLSPKKQVYLPLVGDSSPKEGGEKCNGGVSLVGEKSPNGGGEKSSIGGGENSLTVEKSSNGGGENCLVGEKSCNGGGEKEGPSSGENLSIGGGEVDKGGGAGLSSKGGGLYIFSL